MLSNIKYFLAQREKADCVLRDHRQRYGLGPASSWKGGGEGGGLA